MKQWFTAEAAHRFYDPHLPYMGILSSYIFESLRTFLEDSDDDNEIDAEACTLIMTYSHGCNLRREIV